MAEERHEAADPGWSPVFLGLWVDGSHRMAAEWLRHGTVGSRGDCCAESQEWSVVRCRRKRYPVPVG